MKFPTMSPDKFKKPKRSVTKVFIHCSASDRPSHDNAGTIHQWHLQRGWSGIGYHFFIKKNGILQRARDLERVPAAQAGHNIRSIAICLHGLKKDKFTDAQFETLRKLCNAINKEYGQRITFHGHCEVSSKSCPVFDYKKVLGLDKKGRLAT